MSQKASSQDESKWWGFTELPHGIYRLDELYVKADERCQLYFVRGETQDLIIDSGFGLVPILPHFPFINPDRTTLILTHTHFDHMGGANQFNERWVHELEANVLAKPTAKNTLIDGYLWQEAPEIFEHEPPDWTSLKNYMVESAPATRLLTEGDLIDLGNRQFEIIHTPGHSVGSISLWEAETGVLFCGDVLYDGELLDEVWGANIPDLLESHQRLKALPIDIVYAGHFEPFDKKKMLELIASYKQKRQR